MTPVSLQLLVLLVVRPWRFYGAKASWNLHATRFFPVGGYAVLMITTALLEATGTGLASSARDFEGLLAAGVSLQSEGRFVFAMISRYLFDLDYSIGTTTDDFEVGRGRQTSG